MLNREQYDEAIKATIVGATALARHGNVEAAVSMMVGMSRMCWDLTRPDVTAETLDLTDRMAVMPTLTEKVVSLALTVIRDGEGTPILGYGRGLNADNETLFGDEPDLNNEEGRFADRLMKEGLKEMGVDPNDNPALVSLQSLLKGNTEKIIEDEVAAFSNELDSLFETWTGGGGESPWPPPTSST
jgi:hypothetical protein